MTPPTVAGCRPFPRPARRPVGRKADEGRKPEPGAGVRARLRAPPSQSAETSELVGFPPRPQEAGSSAQAPEPPPRRQMIGVGHPQGRVPGPRSCRYWGLREVIWLLTGPVSNGKRVRWNRLDRFMLFPEGSGDPTKR